MKILETENIIVNAIEERIFHFFIKDFCSITYTDAIEAAEALDANCIKNNMNTKEIQ